MIAPGIDETRTGDFVQSLERGLAVLRAFDAEHPALTLSEVARRTDLSRAAARRFLLTLVSLGYVRSESRVFALRPRVLELGFAYLSTLGLADVAAPHLKALVARLRESASVAVLDGDDIVYVVRVPTRRIMTVTIAVGTASRPTPPPSAACSSPGSAPTSSTPTSTGSTSSR